MNWSTVRVSGSSGGVSENACLTHFYTPEDWGFDTSGKSLILSSVKITPTWVFNGDD